MHSQFTVSEMWHIALAGRAQPRFILPWQVEAENLVRHSLPHHLCALPSHVLSQETAAAIFTHRCITDGTANALKSIHES